MAIPYSMDYIVWFKDETLYNLALSLSGGEPTLAIAPDTVAAIFGLSPYPAYPSGDVSDLPVSISFGSVYGPGYNIKFPSPSGVIVNAVQLQYNVACQPGTPASIWPCPGDGSHDAIFTWTAIWNFSRAAGVGADPPPAPSPIPQRRWIGGAELTANLEGGSGANNAGYTRDATRVADGIGYAIRGAVTTGLWNRTTAQYRTGLATKTSWERFYWRPRRQGAANLGIWQCHCSAGNSAGGWLRWNSTGELRALQNTNFGVVTDMGTVIAAPTIGTWYKVDVLLKYGDGTANSGKQRILINGVDAFSYSDALNNSMSLNGNHANSDIGPVITGTTPDGEYDIDDWICADLPAHIDPVTLLDIPGVDPPIDFIVGSHVRRHFIDPNTGSSTNWTGSRGAMNQGISPQAQLNSQLTSSTALARIEGITDVPDLATVDSQYPNIGIAAAIIGIHGINAGGTDGQLGYKLVGGADVLTTINQVNVANSQSVAYLPSGNNVPVEVSPFHIVHTKSNDANLDTTRAIQAICEYIGTWGPEDDPAYVPPGPNNFIHNNPYSNTPWGYLGGPPASPVYAVGKTYAGNNTYQEVTLPAPAHFVHIRPTTGATSGGLKWFPGAVAAHLGGQVQNNPSFRIWTDLVTGDTKFSVTGSDADLNQTGITYQVIAFCDPGMRFCTSGAFGHGNSATVPFANPLIDPNFLPELVMAEAAEQIDAVSATAGLSIKGPGQPGTRATLATGTLQTDWGTLSLGFINNRTNLQLAQGLSSYIAWRSSEPNCAGTMVQICSYVGNGASPRTINLTPVSNRVPIAVLVVPDAAAACFWRDASHTGANSSNWSSGANSTTAIIAVGVDSIQVQASLNTNLVGYSVWALPGDSAAVLNGEYTNLYCELPSAVWEQPPEYVPGPNVIGEGGITFGGAAAMTLIVNASGLYTLVEGRRHDTIYDGVSGASTADVPIPNPFGKTGYVGG